MSGLPIDNNANKRQRTDNIEDNRITVNVGGKLFPTFRSTLTMKSTYFEKRLSGRFSDDADDSEIIVDRDHEPFSIILSYLRSGKLLISPDKLLFSSVLIEADFYGIDELVDMVRDKCYCNLHHIAIDDYDEECVDICKTEFPSYEEIIEHKFFPSMYFDKVNYYRVISTHILPENKYIQLLKLSDNTFEYIEVWQSVTYECLQSGTIFVEPLVYLRKPTPDWVSKKSPTDWRDEDEPSFDMQFIPASFWVGYYKDIYVKPWLLATKLVFENGDSATSVQYTVKTNNKPVTHNSVVTMVYKMASIPEDIYDTRAYGYGASGLFTEVKRFRNFMHMGPQTEADIALAATPAPVPAPMIPVDVADSDSDDDDSGDGG